METSQITTAADEKALREALLRDPAFVRTLVKPDRRALAVRAVAMASRQNLADFVGTETAVLTGVVAIEALAAAGERMPSDPGLFGSKETMARIGVLWEKCAAKAVLQATRASGTAWRASARRAPR